MVLCVRFKCARTTCFFPPRRREARVVITLKSPRDTVTPVSFTGVPANSSGRGPQGLVRILGQADQ